MRILYRLRPCFLGAILCSGAFLYAGRRPPDIRAYVLVLGGIRNTDCISGRGVDNYPNLNKEILPRGYIFKKLLSENYQFHMPSSQAINYGFAFKCYPERDTEYPSLLQYMMIEYQLPKEKVLGISHWANNVIAKSASGLPVPGCFPYDFNSMDLALASEREKALREDYDKITDVYKQFEFKIFTWPHWDINCRRIYELAVSLFGRYKPDFVHYIMQLPEIAHFGAFAPYIISLRENDVQIRNIWDMIHEDPYYRGRTYLVICPDHSRDRNYEAHSESFFDAPEYTWLYIYGPGVEKGINEETVVYHKDIFATMSALLDLNVHQNDGRDLSGYFLKKK